MEEAIELKSWNFPPTLDSVCMCENNLLQFL